jgi:hypothetical protein
MLRPVTIFGKMEKLLRCNECNQIAPQKIRLANGEAGSNTFKRS